ncbi:MAG: hypothetical protein ACJASV_002995 [Pseudorhodobacter sp.]|jgi:hypothetical protein
MKIANTLLSRFRSAPKPENDTFTLRLSRLERYRFTTLPQFALFRRLAGRRAA